MERILRHLLKPYEKCEFVLRLKVRFIAYCYLTELLVISAAIIYTGYANLSNPLTGYMINFKVLGTLMGGLAVTMLGVVILARGHYTAAAHLLLSCGFAIVWTVIFFDNTHIVARLDTIVLIVGLLSMTPIVILKRPLGIVLYGIANSVLLYTFMFLFREVLNLPYASFISYLSDNTITILAVTFISYQVYSINRQALEKAELDISERKKAEEALRESEEKYRLIADNTADLISVLDMNLHFTYVSPASMRLRGYTAEEAMQQTIDQVLTPESMQLGLSIFEEEMHLEASGTADPDRTRILELEEYRKDGSTVWVEVNLSFLRDKDRKPVGILIVTRDISERKRAEGRLVESEDRFNRAITGTGAGLWDWDMVKNTVFFSRQWKSMLGYADHEVENDFSGWKNLWHPEDAARIEKAVNDYIEARTTVYEIEHRLRHKDGSWHWILTRGDIERDAAGKPFRWTGTNIDITERKQAEKEQEKLKEQLNQAQKMEAIGQLAGGVAHDFNNMLNIILGYSQLALMKIEPSSPLKVDLQEINNATQRSTELVRQLLAFARKQTIVPKELDLNDTVAGMLNMLQRLIGEDIDLLWMPAANLWPVKMDPTQVDQILANLAVNARDSISGVGKITIETGKMEFDEAYCSQHSGFAPGQYVLLAVSDNGCGMDKETCEQIFEPFFTTKEFGKGTGMGLATVYGIVKQNNGFINVYSEPGKGSTFKIYLPRFGEEETAIAEPSAHTEPLTGTETVLLVEDNEALLKMSKMMLEELGYNVLAASSPNEAIKRTEQYTGDINLVLTDVVMPEMSGRDLQKRISAIRPDMKYLFMSGYTANVIAHRGILDKGIVFLQKPFLMDALATKVREALE